MRKNLLFNRARDASIPTPPGSNGKSYESLNIILPMLNKSKKLHRANLWLFVAVAAYFLMNGAQLWETAIMIPAWTAAPPESLFFFKGPYGVDFKVFWIVVHSVHEVLMITALVLNWSFKKRRNFMIFLFLAHISVRVWTLQYFAPVIMEFQAMEVKDMVESALVDKAARWRNLNYLRVGLFYLINIGYAGLLFDQSNQESHTAVGQ